MMFAKLSLDYLPSIRHIAVALRKVWIYGKSLLVFCNAHVIITDLQQIRNSSMSENVG